jgi:hypothetical protein
LYVQELRANEIQVCAPDKLSKHLGLQRANAAIREAQTRKKLNQQISIIHASKVPSDPVVEVNLSGSGSGKRTLSIDASLSGSSSERRTPVEGTPTANTEGNLSGKRASVSNMDANLASSGKRGSVNNMEGTKLARRGTVASMERQLASESSNTGSSKDGQNTAGLVGKSTFKEVNGMSARRSSFYRAPTAPAITAKGRAVESTSDSFLCVADQCAIM